MNIFLDANICLDLLDTTRPTSSKSVEWYMSNKDNEGMAFYFSGDFITTFYYILVEKRGHDPIKTIEAIDAMSSEIEPCYITHSDFLGAKNQFFSGGFHDFEDLIILNSTNRMNGDTFLTNDKSLLELENYFGMKIVSP